ncbi:MAG: metalloenzyme [Melioribacteraceae bacterium]
MHSTLMIFLDGVGIGKRDYQFNPFFKYQFKMFTEIFGEIPHLENQHLSVNGRYVFPIDALLGIPDIPLSGTGQTSIFCGVNAQKILGKHFGPYPHSELIPVIKEKNIFIEFLRRKKKVAFVNAYPKIFFDYVKRGKRILSVTTLSCLLSNVRLNKIKDIHQGKALSADIENYRLINKMNYKLPLFTPEKAAKRLLRIANKNHFTLFEYFYTDHLGHGRNLELFDRTIHVFDNFIYYVIKNLPSNMTLLICSDHGNFEDLSIKAHTLNPALGIAAGKFGSTLAKKIKKLNHIKSAILELYD